MRENATGLLVQPEEPQALADALARLARDSQMRIEFGNAARSWITTPDENGFPRFSLDAMLSGLERLYQRLGSS